MVADNFFASILPAKRLLEDDITLLEHSEVIVRDQAAKLFKEISDVGKFTVCRIKTVQS